MRTGLFIFTNDLRIQDNTGLREACSQCNRLYTCYINPEPNPQNKHYTQFGLACLDELAHDVGSVGGELILSKISEIPGLVRTKDITHIFYNNKHIFIENLCKKLNIQYSSDYDNYLYEPGTILSGGGTIYKKFTPFYNQVLHVTVESPFYIRKFDMLMRLSNTKSSNSVMKGRTLGIKLLKNTLKTQKNYAKLHNMLAYETSHLSPHINFGTVSVREVYHVFFKYFGVQSEILRQLIWHDFYAHILYGYPEILTKKNEFRWTGSRKHYELWCKGQTGVPVVDACMRQLNETGQMHNRGRMIVACFLVKTLLIDWRLGEQYFAKRLTDYDLASNNGNWQWIAGTGVDPMPYFRIFNPWTQAKKLDPDAEYIKRWVPELSDLAAKYIHDQARMNSIVDFKEQSRKYLEFYV